MIAYTNGMTTAPTVDPVGKTQNGLRAVNFGDSYKAIDLSYTGTPDTPGGFREQTCRSPMTWLKYWSGQRLNFVGEFGATGETTGQWLNRYESQVPAARPDIVFMGSAGINDMNNGVTVTQAFANFRRMWDRNAQIGALTVQYGVVPYGNGSATTSQKTWIHTMQSLMRQEARTRRNFLYVDFHDAVSDLTTGDGWINAAVAQYTADGIHPGVWGAARMGRRLLRALTPILLRSGGFASGAASVNAAGPGEKQLLLNGGMTGTAGTVANGVTGAVADSWTVNSQSGGAIAGTVTCAKVTNATLAAALPADTLRDLYLDEWGGDWQQIVLSGTASAISLLQNVTSGYQIGKNYRSVMEMVIGDDFAPTSTFVHRFQANITGGNAIAQDMELAGIDGTTIGFPPDPRPRRGISMTPTLLAGPGCSRLQTNITIAGTGTLYFRRAAIIQVD